MKIISGPNGMNHVFDPQWDAPKQCSHMDYWHNDEMFLIESTKSRNGKKAKTCISCQRCFPKRNPCMGEGDTVISHQERYSYPMKDERGKVLRWDISRYKKVTKLYCANKSCLLKRHQYAWKGLLVITEDSREYFTEEHYNYMFEELHYCD